MRPHTTAFMGMWRGLPTAGGRGTQLSLLPALARQCRKGTVQLWFTRSDDEPISFTSVRAAAFLDAQRRLTRASGSRRGLLDFVSWCQGPPMNCAEVPLRKDTYLSIFTSPTPPYHTWELRQPSEPANNRQPA